MAVQSVTEMMDQGCRSMRWDFTVGRSYTRKFRVITNTQNDGPRSVILQVASKLGDKYECSYNSSEKDFAYATAYAVDQVGEDGLEWIISIDYTPGNPNATGGGPDNNPLDVPIDVKWGFRDHEIVLERDINGDLVANTAGDPFDPPVTVDDPRLLMTVTRNEATFNFAWVVQYRNAINTDPFAGFDPYFCKVLNIEATNQFNQDVGWYYTVTYQFEFICPKVNDITDGFRKKILSQGYRALGRASGLPFHVSYKGVEVNSPVLLDEGGHALVSGAPAHFIDVPAYPELPFSVFNFDPDAISGQRTGLNYAPGSPTS